MVSPGPATTETRVTSRGIRGLDDGDDMEETISPMKFTRGGFDGGRNGGGPDYDWDEASPGRGSRSVVESREYLFCNYSYCIMLSKLLLSFYAQLMTSVGEALSWKILPYCTQQPTRSSTNV